MAGTAIDIHRIEALRRRIEHFEAPTPELLRDIIAAVGAVSPDKAAQLHEWLERKAFAQIAFALVEWNLPDYSVRRLVQENHVWWCAIAHRTMIDWGGAEEDEWHEDMTLAILKSCLTVLCHPREEDDDPTPPPRRAVPAVPRRPAVSGAAPLLRLYEILIKPLVPASRSFMRPVK